MSLNFICNFRKSVSEIIGFLKKLPLFPILFGSGSLLFLMEITASLMFLIVGKSIFLEEGST